MTPPNQQGLRCDSEKKLTIFRQMEGRLLSGFESQSQDLGLPQRCDSALKVKQILIDSSSGVKSNYFYKKNSII